MKNLDGDSVDFALCELRIEGGMRNQHARYQFNVNCMTLLELVGMMRKLLAQCKHTKPNLVQVTWPPMLTSEQSARHDDALCAALKSCPQAHVVTKALRYRKWHTTTFHGIGAAKQMLAWLGKLCPQAPKVVRTKVYYFCNEKLKLVQTFIDNAAITPITLRDLFGGPVVVYFICGKDPVDKTVTGAGQRFKAFNNVCFKYGDYYVTWAQRVSHLTMESAGSMLARLAAMGANGTQLESLRSPQPPHVPIKKSALTKVELLGLSKWMENAIKEKPNKK